MNVNRLSKFSILFLIVICFTSRLPQLLSENLLLDGDECIVGLMAKHAFEGEKIPFFFYGQPYAFSFVETEVIKLFYHAFGISEIAIKLAMLTLWCIGVIFFHKTLIEIGSKNKLVPFLITLVFVLSPSFAVWSMKARGGYLTAFLLTSIITFLIFNRKLKYNKLTTLLIGFLITYVYQSQAIWLIGLIPIVAFYILTKNYVKRFFLVIFGMATGMLTFHFMKNIFKFPKLTKWPKLELDIFLSIPQRVYQNLTGSYNYGKFIEPAISIKLLALITTILIFFSIAASVFFLIKKKKVNPLFYATCLSVISIIAFSYCVKNFHLRYLLPLSGFTYLMLFLLINNLKNIKLVMLPLCLLISISAYAMYDFSNYKTGSKEQLYSLISKLQSNNVTHIFCEGGLLQWQIMFYSKEEIMCRSTSNRDRRQKYVERVNEEFEKNVQNTAIVGYYNKRFVATLNSSITIDDVFYIQIPANKEVLNKRGFDLTKPIKREKPKNPLRIFFSKLFGFDR